MTQLACPQAGKSASQQAYDSRSAAPCNVQLLLAGQGSARRLLAVSQGGVKDADIVWVIYAARDVCWAWSSSSSSIHASSDTLVGRAAGNIQPAARPPQGCCAANQSLAGRRALCQAHDGTEVHTAPISDDATTCRALTVSSDDSHRKLPSAEEVMQIVTC